MDTSVGTCFAFAWLTAVLGVLIYILYKGINFGGMFYLKVIFVVESAVLAFSATFGWIVGPDSTRPQVFTPCVVMIVFDLTVWFGILFYEELNGRSTHR